jgi:citrate lyase subunit beta/citryl-CoA lyase
MVVQKSKKIPACNRMIRHLSTKVRSVTSLAFIPSFQEMLLKAPSKSSPDAFIPDLEDSVPSHEKIAARDRLELFLKSMPSDVRSKSLWIPRINGLETQWFEDDLRAVVSPAVDGVSVGKISSVEDLRAICKLLDHLEAQRGLTQRVKILPWLETARGVMHAREICEVMSERLLGVAFGLDDYLSDVGIAAESTTDRDTASLFARSQVALAANAAGLRAFESPVSAILSVCLRSWRQQLKHSLLISKIRMACSRIAIVRD